jgi:hypothetical protein
MFLDFMSVLLAGLALITLEPDRIVLVPLQVLGEVAQGDVPNVPILHLLQVHLQYVMFVQALTQEEHVILVALARTLPHVQVALVPRLIQEEGFTDILALFIV